MGSTAENDYAEFEEKVRRTMYLDNLAPYVTESMLRRTAFDQFANVKSVKLIPNYLEPNNVAQCALVELDSPKKANEIVSMIQQNVILSYRNSVKQVIVLDY